MTGQAVGVQREEKGRNNTALGCSSTDGPRVRDVLPPPNKLNEITNGIVHIKLGELILKQG